jgi:hypothetical protein
VNTREVVFIGDCHGNIQRLLSILMRYPAAHRIFQLGDMALGFPNTILPHCSPNFKFIRGNHDSPADCRAHLNYLGDYGYYSDLKLFYLGGAYSIDHEWRKAHNRMHPRQPVWWEDEQLGEEDLASAFKLYVDVKPNLVISHEAPSRVAKEPSFINAVISTHACGMDKLNSGNSRTSKALDAMLAHHEPALWLFGHYHVNWDSSVSRSHRYYEHEARVDDTRFICLPELTTKKILVKDDGEIDVISKGE